jgi:hypothetical protein
MRSSYHDCFGELLLEVRGDGGRSTSQFREMYTHFQTDDPGTDPDMVVERTTAVPDPDVVLGDPNDHYGWTGDRFVRQSGSEFMLVEPGWEHIYVSPDWDPSAAVSPVDFAIRCRMVDNGTALVNASAVELDGQTTLFPAWRGPGKMATLRSVLRAGGNFLAADRLWVGGEGDVRGYPSAVEFDSFPERAPSSQKSIRSQNSGCLNGDGRRAPSVESLLSSSTGRERSRADNLVFLRASPTTDSVTIEPMSTEAALSDLRSVNHSGWNRRLGEYFDAYDALVPDDSMQDRLHRVVDREEAILTELLQFTDAYVASIPRETDWGETGTDDDIVEAVRSLGNSQSVTVAQDD